MITSARPITTLISNADKVGSEAQLSHSTHSDEDEKERVIMGFDVSHCSTVSKEMKESQSFRIARYGLEVRRTDQSNSSHPGPLRAFYSWPPCSCETCEEHEGKYRQTCLNTSYSGSLRRCTDGNSNYVDRVLYQISIGLRFFHQRTFQDLVYISAAMYNGNLNSRGI